jgi:hypothetical protein
MNAAVNKAQKDTLTELNPITSSSLFYYLFGEMRMRADGGING